MKHPLTLLGILMLTAGVALGQATPPGYMNYQGVLRDASDAPLDGPHDMVFFFYDSDGGPDCTGGNLLLVDSHMAAGSGAVEVTGGMFNVDLGGGTITVGSASTLAEVFRDNTEVWIEPDVGGEHLCPRIRILSAGYAINAAHLSGRPAGNASGQIPISNGTVNSNLNADRLDGYTSNSFGRKSGSNAWDGLNTFSNPGNTFIGDGSGLTGIAASNADLLDGHDSAYFIDTSANEQTKTGPLIVDASPFVNYGIQAESRIAGGYFRDSDGSGYAYVGVADEGILAYGNESGGTFADNDDSGRAQVGVGDRGIEASGNGAGGFFEDTNSTGRAYVAYGNRGIEAQGTEMGGVFLDSDGSGQANLGQGDAGIVAYGNLYAGYFDESDGSGKAILASGEVGVDAEGSVAGGYFRDLDGTGEAYLGYGARGIEASGNDMGGYFKDAQDTSWAALGWGGDGISAHGNSQGGYFSDNQGTSSAHVAYGDRGIEASGNEEGGLFLDSHGTSTAHVAYAGRGIQASGNDMGGDFQDEHGTSTAYVAYGARGIEAYGDDTGGYFEDSNGTGQAWVGYNLAGISAKGTWVGGLFQDTDSSGVAWIAHGDDGLEAHGNYRGGYFKDLDETGEAYVGFGNMGIEAKGTAAGGHFIDTNHDGEVWAAYSTTLDSTIYSYGVFAKGGNGAGGYFTSPSGFGVFGHGNPFGVYGHAPIPGSFENHVDGNWSDIAAGSIHKIVGSGAPAFIQNHPHNDDRVITYMSLEGDEVATFTRGSARLIAGEARVLLGETFRWVTNPDIGLTAYVTARGDCGNLYIDSITTEEIVVRESGGGSSDVAFDYIVLGLRIGFEESAIVREKGREAYIPSMVSEQMLLARLPELRRFTPMERFARMRTEIGAEAELDLRASQELKDAIEEYDPAVHGKLEIKPGIVLERPVGGANPRDLTVVAAGPPAAPPSRQPVQDAGLRPDADGNVHGDSARPDSCDPASQFPVGEPVEAGDVLVIDPENPGLMRMSRVPGDARVFGIVTGEPGLVLGAEAPVALSGVVVCKVDAGYGEIRPGDLLTTSATPGHAMLNLDPGTGTILGKALEPLAVGTGQIKILITLR